VFSASAPPSQLVERKDFGGSMRSAARSRADMMFGYAPVAGTDPTGFSLVSDRFVCTLEPLASHEKLLALWEILDDDSSQFEDILTYFARDGIARLPSFALAQLVDTATGSVLLAVRGAGRIELNGPGSGSYVGAGATTWVEGSAQNVIGMVLCLGSVDEPQQRLPLLRGIVSSTSVSWGEPLSSTSNSSSANTATVGDLPDLTDLPDWALPTYVDADVTRSRSASGRPQLSVVDDLPDDEDKTVFVRGSRATAIPDLDEDADKTVMLASRKKRNSNKAHGPRLGLPDGSTAELDAPVIVGRKPRVEPGAAVIPRLVTVSSPTSEVSSNHIEFSIENGVVRVRDLNSTNGSIIRSPGRESFILASGETVSASTGTDVDIGDGNVVTIVS
jgi:FHA domain